jgi:PAS domain S-box-containing protein
VGILFAIYFGAAKLGLLLDAVSGFASAVWPPTGISLVALSMFGYRLWPGIALGAFLVNVSAGAPPLTAMGMAAGNTLEALVGTYLLRRVIGFHHSLDRLVDVCGLVGLAALLSTLVSATVGVTSGWLGGVISSAHYREAWWTWWLGDMNGDLVVAPLLFTWGSRPRIQLTRRRIPEVVVFLGSVLAVSLLVLGDVWDAKITLPYLLFPFLIWGALRFGQHGAVTALSLVSTVAIWVAAQGAGPFLRATLHDSLFALQAFMSIVAVTILVLAAAEETLRSSEARKAAILESALDAIIILDQAGKIVELNPAAEQIFRYSGAESLGKDMSALLMTPALLDGRSQPLARDLAEGAISLLGKRLEMPARRADGVEFPAELTMTRIPIHGAPMYTMYVRDITERTRTERKLQESESRFRQLAENIQEVFWMADPVGAQILYISPAYEQIWGRTCQSLYEEPSSFLEAIHSEDRAHVRAALEQQRRGERTDTEYRIVQPGGAVRWIWDRGFPIQDEHRRTSRFVGIAQDITQRRQAEEQLRALLHEKEVLLKEIHHRVKNNLQVICSLLDLQSDYIQDPQALQIFQESQQRIKSMALIHEQLYQSGNLAKIDMAEYMEHLTAGLLRSYSMTADRISLRITAEEVFLNLDTAIPCGLILNELVTNCLKHAFPEGRAGVITVTLRAEPAGKFFLRVCDNGVGFPAGIDFRKAESLGLQLVSMLTEQLDGVIELDRHEGTAFTLTFAELPYKLGR